MARRGGSDSGAAYAYNLGIAQLNEKQREDAARDARESQRDQNSELHEQLRDSMAQQGERLRAATAIDTYSREMAKMKDQEQTALDSAKFRSVYRLLKDSDPNRNAQLSQLFQDFPGAARNPEVQKDISEDDKRINTTNKAGLTQQEQKFLDANGPGSKGYKDLQTSAGDTGAADHVTSAIKYGHVWDLMKKSIGSPSGTPEGVNTNDYVKGIESTFEKLHNGQPNPAYQPPAGAAPAPSTPAPENTSAWANTDLTGKVAPLSGVTPPATATPAAGTQPAAAPTSQGARDFLQNMFKKTSEAAPPAPVVADNRSDLNDMMNQSPETQFAAPKASPPPSPTPAPQNKDQYYTA